MNFSNTHRPLLLASALACLAPLACGGGSGSTTSGAGGAGSTASSSGSTTSGSSTTSATSSTSGTTGTSSSATTGTTGASTGTGTGSTGAGGGAPGCSPKPALPTTHFEFDGASGTMNFFLPPYTVQSVPPNWQMSGRDTNGMPSFGVGIQFLQKPTASKTYQAQDYGVVMDADHAFVYVSMVNGAKFVNYNGVAGGCIVVTVDAGGKVTASFNDLALTMGKTVSATVTTP